MHLRSQLFQEAIENFNATQGEQACMVSKAELDAIKMLDEQSKAFRQRLHQHWQAYSAKASAATFKTLSHPCLDLKRSPPVTKAQNPLWFETFTNSQEANFHWLERSIQAFTNRHQQRKALTGKSIGLGGGNAATFRDAGVQRVQRLAM